MGSRTLSRRLRLIRRMRPILPNWAKMAEFEARQSPDGTDDATGWWNADRAVISVGNKSFFMKSDLVMSQPEIWDFAVFGLAAISSRTNRVIRFDKPVSKSVAESLKKMHYAYQLWCIPSLSPPRIKLNNIVDDPVQLANSEKIICLSGGIDSTSAAISAKVEANYTQALLIAGADYPSAGDPGFSQLRERVYSISTILGLRLTVLETNYRTMSIDWELQHGFLLAMALHYHSANFMEGSYALDIPSICDVVMFPWGNSAALLGLFSTEYLPIKSYASDLHRIEKVKKIYNHDKEILKSLSVCWSDTSKGSNCGVCNKCQRTRDLFERIGVDTALMFDRLPSENDVKMLNIRLKKNKNPRVALTMSSEWLSAPENIGPDLMDLRRIYVRQMPYR